MKLSYRVRMKRVLLVVFGGLVVACASSPRSADAPRVEKGGPETERALPIPVDLAQHIQESIAIGRELYFLDKASAIGTDVLRENVPEPGTRGLGGWLTVRNGDDHGKVLDSFGVTFITKDEPPRMVFRIDVPFKGKPTFKEISPPKDLNEVGICLFRARQAAIDAAPRASRPFNPVIVPGSWVHRRDALAVYLLAAEQRAGEMVFGIHYRVLVSSDCATVKEVLPLSKTALVVPPPAESIPPGATPVASFVSQIVTDWPLETHVFVSMLHNRTPIYVGTQRGTWLVIGDKITLVDDKPPGDAR